jgi:cyclic-di-GMP phosphodiesterase, flagellum assembly factor TipF
METIADLPLEMPPESQDAIVYASIAAIAAAAGLGAYHEAGAAGWLSVTAAGLTALALAGMHRGLNPVGPTMPTPRKIKSNRVRSDLAEAAPAPAATVVPAVAAVPRAAAAIVAPIAVAGSAPPKAASAPAPTLAHDAPRAELAQFTPRQPAPALPAAKPSPFAAPKPDIDLAHLDKLVRQMAAGVPGPRAATPDPDRTPASTPRATEASAPSASALRVGFGAPAVAAHSGQRVADAIAAERFDVLLAPIQSLADQRPSHFEVFMRLRDANGTILTDAEVSEAARNTGLAGAIDALKLPRVARVARKVQARGGSPADVLAGVFGDSLTDRAFIDALDGAMAGETPPPVVLAFSQSDVRAFGRVHWWALATLVDVGLHFAISDLTDLDLDLDLLAARGFRFVKLDADVFLNGLPHGPMVIPPADLTRHLGSNGLQIIVGRIEAQEQMDRIAACGVGLGQGDLFGTAKPVRREILDG